jgi:hypothetical protein
MADFGFNPEIKALGIIPPFRMVMVAAGQPFTGQAATIAAKTVLGVTDGSVSRFGSIYNAENGDPVNFQPSMTVQVEAGAAIIAGALLASDSAGRAVAATSGQAAPYIALEAAAATGEIIRAWRINAVA